MPRCIPGAHLAKAGHCHMRRITPENIAAYKHCCMLKNNPNDDVSLDDEVRICTTCWILITREIASPTEPVLNPERKNFFEYKTPRILDGRCFLCDAENPLYLVPFKCKVDFFVKTGAFLPGEAKCCKSHVLFDKEFVMDVHFLQIQTEDGLVTMSSDETSAWFQVLRASSCSMTPSGTLNRIISLEDDDFRQVLGIRREQFKDLCNTVCGYKDRRLVCRPVSVDLFLMKLRNCQYLLFLKALFGYKSRGAVSTQIRIARLACKTLFAPLHLGPAAHPRPESLKHVNPLAKELHLTPDNEGNSILIVDGTYVYIPKSSNFTVLKRSYSQHKGRHLLKITVLVFPDGHIFDVHGPYFADGKNNDAATLKHDLRKDISGLKGWMIPGDVLVVDRGYRDAAKFLQAMGISVAIPHCQPRGAGQPETLNANRSRLVAKTRWVVEARNGHVTQIFKYLGRSIHAGSVPYIGDYFRICCALINAYYPDIQISEQSLAAGEKMVQRKNSANILQNYLSSKNLLNPRIQRVWRDIRDEELEEFPRITIDDLYELTLGVFQIKLAKSYVAGLDNFRFQVYKEEDLLRVKMWSRHSSSSFYFLFIRFAPGCNGVNGIVGWYCTCMVGARTFGMCSHTCAILWYLGYARYEPIVPQPPNVILESTLDAADRFAGVVVVEDDELFPEIELNVDAAAGEEDGNEIVEVVINAAELVFE